MRTTLTLDDDVARLLKRESHRAEESFKATVNRCLRRGLEQTGTSPRKPFKVKTFSMDLPAAWTSHKVEDLLDLLEGPDRK